MKPSFILSVLVALAGLSSSTISAFVNPPWWDLISRDFRGVNLRRCFKRQFAPAEGQRCGRNAKTCYFGTQDCPRVGPYPIQECFCNGDGLSGGTWSCTVQECPEDADLVPSASPSRSSSPTTPQSGEADLWRPLGQTVFGGGPGDSDFGERVALSADSRTLAVSAENSIDPSTGLQVGSATTYRLIGNNWTQLGGTLFGVVENAEFGEDMDISADGNTLVVGADCDLRCTGPGYVSVFKFNGTEWGLVGERIFAGDVSGFGGEVDVSADGSVVVATAQEEEMVDIFTVGDDTVTLLQRIEGGGGNLSSAFGSSIAISGDSLTLAIGSIPLNVSRAQVGNVTTYVFNPDSGEYEFKLALFGQNGFGRSVALNTDGSIIAVGDNQGGDFGEVTVFTSQSGSWVQLGQTLSGDANLDSFGDAVALNDAGDILAISSDDGLGFVRTFDLVINTWTPLGQQLVGRNANGEFGSEISLSASGFVLAVGVEEDGAVRVFRYA